MGLTKNQKSELLSYPFDHVTNEMVAKAQKDKKRRKRYKTWDGHYSYYDARYTCGSYVSAKKCRDNLLRISVFLTEDLRKGATLPVVQVFIDTETDMYHTYLTFEEKWSVASLDYFFYKTESFTCARRSSTFSSVDDESRSLILEMLNIRDNDYAKETDILDIVSNWQVDSRERRRDARWERQRKPWDEDNADVCEKTPKGVESYVRHHMGLDEYFIYEEKGKETTTGYCTHCGKYVTVRSTKNLRSSRNQPETKKGTIVCPHCGTRLTCKCSKRRSTDIYTNEKTLHVIQPYHNGFVSRLFLVSVGFEKDWPEKSSVNMFEERRMIVDENGPRAYYYGNFHNRMYTWIKIGVDEMHPVYTGLWKEYFCKVNGYVYLDKRQFPKSNLIWKKGFVEYCSKYTDGLSPERYMYGITESRCPSTVESLVKVGARHLAEDVLHDEECGGSYYYSFYSSGTNRYLCLKDSGPLAKRFGIDNFRMKRLIACDGGRFTLNWFKKEKEENTVYSDELLTDFAKYEIKPDTFDFIPKTVSLSVVKCLHYVKKQAVRKDVKAAIVQWRDYLNMADRLKYNLSSLLLVMPKDLPAAHKKCIAILSNGALEEKASYYEGRFPEVNKTCQKINEKYAFSDESYAFVIPSGVLDIIKDGNALNHCVGTCDIYYDRISRKESFIGFLRAAAHPDVPYYTVEFEPNGTVRQIRTTGDRQMKDIGTLRSWLKNVWQKEIAKRLSKEDSLLAMDASAMRKKEFEDLRKSGTLIHNGVLAGTPLIDVLEKDLMLADAVEAAG